MAFIQLTYFYIVLLSVLIIPQDVMSRKRVRESNKSTFTTPSSPAISAVLLECPNVRRRESSKADCERQMMVHIRVSPSFQIETLDKFLLLEEVYDQRRQTKAKLMSPYLIEISRGEPVIMYPLQFTKSIRCDTCGHKNGNNTSQGACEQQPLVPLKAPAVRNNMGSVAAAYPMVPATDTPPTSGLHPPRSAQQHNDNEASMGKSPNPRPKPVEKIESLRKPTIGIKDAPPPVQPKNPANAEKCFSSSDMSFRDVDDNGAVYGMEYDAGEYDERNLSDDTLTGRGRERGLPIQNTFRDKRLKTRPLDPSSSSENEKLFREAERQSEEARLDTISAFRIKHAHPVATVVATSAVGGGGVTGYGSSSWANAGKPHVAGIQEDCIRPQGDLETDGVDVDVDFGGKPVVGKKQERMKSKLLDGYGYRLSEGETRNMQRPHLVAVQKATQSHWLDNQFPENSFYGAQSSDQSQEDSSRENTFPSRSKAVLGNLRLWQQHQQRQEPDDSYNDATKRKFLFAEDIDAQGVGSSNSDDDVGDEDYDRVDASGRDSSVIESKSSTSIAKIDDSETAAGGMGDEFYWNTLNYPQGHDSYSRNNNNRELGRKVFDSYKIGGFDSGKLNKPSDHNTPKRLSHENNGKVRQNGSNKSKEKMKKIPVVGRGATAIDRNLNNHQQTGYDNFAPRTLFKNGQNDKNQATKNAKGDEHKKSENFSDKSAIARMKIRSSDAAVDDGGGVVETSGMYTAKDGVVPAFPLNGYPGYLEVKTSSQYIPPAPSESNYKMLENVPQEFIPRQPPFAKELGDPNLTVNDKINLLEVLTAHDEVNDAILRKLENELDNSLIVHDLSNHDRMPMPSTRSLPSKRQKDVKKRSYLMYDDLTMRDTNDQYDDLDIERPIDVPLSGDESVSSTDDIASCNSCGGKKCNAKIGNDKSCVCDREGRHCKCLQKEEKKIRSVSDAWYSVFNMSAPLQFLTTRVGIYRKRHGAWWRIAPSITLTSLSGIYANGNLSILFSSHVDIFQLRRPLSLENHKLLIPHDGDDVGAVHPNLFESIDPSDILAIDSTKFNFNAIRDNKGTDHKEEDQTEINAERSLCQATISAAEHRRKRRSHSSSDAVLSIGDLGYFPGNMNILEQCPSDEKHLCLNMLDEEVPAFTIKIKQPFLENALIYSGEYKVRIASVISDATTKSALQVAVVLVNEGCVAHEFTICICNCPMTCGSKTTVKKDLAPHVSETISFLLPLEENRDTKLHCNVEVKSPDQKVISKRKFIVEPTARCLCIWDCDCHCIQDLVSHDDYNVCHKLGDYEEHAAGFIDDDGGGLLDQELTGWWRFGWRMKHYAFNLLLCTLFLGLLKAVLGALAVRRIDRCGYDYVQPLQKYDYASRCRRFFINIVFFVVLPFIFCCKCFTPTEEDLLIASTEWQCSLMQQVVSEDSSGDGGGWKPFGRYEGGGDNENDDDDEEETILSQRFESGDGSRGVSQSRLTEYLIDTCDYDEEEEERDTNYVLQALTESRESIRKLLNSHYSDDLDPKNPLTKDADELVRRLVAAKMVYRTFHMPLKNVDVPLGQKYSIRGYFEPTIGLKYQYFTPSPLAQVRRITANTSALMVTPVILPAEDFSRVYAGKLEVLEAGDLSVDPPEDAPCINSSNILNESQLTTSPTLLTLSSPQAPSNPADSIANDVVTEPETATATANDSAARSESITGASNGSNLTTKQKDSPKGNE